MSFVIEKNKLKQYIPEGETDLFIPDGVDSIAANVFKDCETIERVTLPDSLTTIGQRAFSKCTNLRSIAIPDSVKSIANYAFFECRNLTGIKLPKQMDRIGDSAFSGCTNLREVVFPQSVGETGKYLFFNCDGLADQNGFAVVNGVLYTYCGNAEVIRVPDTVHTIGDRAFESKVVEMTCMGELRQVRRVQRIVLPQSVKRIGERTFDGIAAEDIVSFGIPIRDFPSPELKKLALIGYAGEYQAFQTFPEIVRQNNAYIGTYQKRYLPFVFETDFAECIRILAETGKIDPKEFDEVYLAPAQAAGAVQCTAALIAWRSKLAK